MAITKTFMTVLSSGTVTPGGTKSAPSVSSPSKDCSTYYGGELTWKITNGSSAPATPPVLTFQVSHDGTNWYDYYTVGGDTTASSISSGSIQLDRGVMYLRVLAYGNTTNSVTVEAYLQAVTGV